MIQRKKGRYINYVLTFFFFYYCMSAFGSVLSVYLAQIGIGIADLSFIVSSSSLFGFFMIPAAGFLSDRTGKPRQFCALLMIGIGVFALLFSTSRQVGILFLLNGLTMSLLNAAMPVTERLAGAVSYRYGILRVWGTIGYAAGAQAAGLILQHLPAWVLFASVLAAGCLAAFGISGAEDPIPEKEGAGEGPESGPVSLRLILTTLIHDHQYLLYLIIAMLHWGCSAVNMTYVPILLTGLGMEAGTVGTIISVSTLAEIPLILFSDRFMDRFSVKKLLFFTCTLSALEFLTFSFSQSVLPVAAAIILLKAIATTLFMMISLKLCRSLLPREMITTGLAVVNTCSNIGLILLQNIGGMLLEHISLQRFYLLMAGIILFVMLLAGFLKTGKERSVFG